MGAFFIKDGYVDRIAPEYFIDSKPITHDIVHQPDVYKFASYLARRFGCEYIIDIGCGQAHKLIELQDSFKLVGVDYGANIGFCKEHYSFGLWIECDLEHTSELAIPEAIVRKSIVVCSDVIEHLIHPDNLLALLRNLMQFAPAGILTTPERDLVRGIADCGPPANPCHVREWTMLELDELLKRSGIYVEHLGLTFNNSVNLEKKTIAAVLGVPHSLSSALPPDDFSVVAIMTVYNEQDIILPSIERLISQGVFVYLIDNWSTDGSIARVRHLLGRGIVGIEQFPADGPPTYYQWKELLTRVEQLSFDQGIVADWYIHHDVDEVRETPWNDITLRDGLYRVGEAGFNCIDHTCLVFHPTDNGFVAGEDFQGYFKYFEFGRRQGHFKQSKAWKNLEYPVSLASSGGHEVSFEGKKTYPYKFLLKHYPIRSQQHGNKKVLGERRPRWSPQERSAGWHTHYDDVDSNHDFLKARDGLEFFSENNFSSNYLFERLAGVGVYHVKSNRF